MVFDLELDDTHVLMVGFERANLKHSTARRSLKRVREAVVHARHGIGITTGHPASQRRVRLAFETSGSAAISAIVSS